MVTNNPFLGPQWEDLAAVLETSLVQTYVGHTFQIQTYAKQFNLSPSTSPFVQAMVSEDVLQVEIAANLMVNPKLTTEQYQAMEFYGWELPEVGPDEYGQNAGGNPNMVRFFDLETSPKQIVEAILTALVGVYGIVESDFWGFSNKSESDRVGAMGLLGRIKKSPTNPFQCIFALPGHHLEMLEQTNEDHI
jgi:hypothetical protein